MTYVGWWVQGKTPRAALKKAGARGGRSTAQRSGRRISFAEQESQEEPASADDGEIEEEVNGGGHEIDSLCAR